MRTVRYITSILLLSLFMAACSRSPLENKIGLALSSYFSDSEDNGSELSIQGLWFFNSDSGELVHTTGWRYPQDLASTFFTLPHGSYLVVLGANLDLPLKVEGSDSPQTLRYSLDEASSRKVFTACAELKDYAPTRIENLDMHLNRVMAELCIEIQDAPQGLQTEVEAVNCAAAFYPALKNPSGTWGNPSSEIQSVSFNSLSATLMPTAAGREWSFFHITMTTAEGIVLETYIEAPRMEAGERYLMSLKYEEIQSFMHLSSCPISDWTEGWVYDGDIPDPIN